MQSFVSNIELMWEDPSIARFLGRLASFARLIVFDGRGFGISDRVAVDHVPTMDERVEDAVAVLDAVGSDQPAVFGVNGGGHPAMYLAATRPERVRSLVLFNTWATMVHAPDLDQRESQEVADRFIEQLEATWGRPNTLFSDDTTPSRQRWRARLQRQSLGPNGAAHVQRADFERDLRPLLPSIHTPTLVVQTESGEQRGQLLVEGIPDARLRLVEAGDVMQWTLADTDPVLAEVEEFLIGTRSATDGEVLVATVLFTDIVSSTAREAELGSHDWRKVLDEHDAMVRTTLRRHRGREVKTLGDGFLAVFDGATRAIRCATDITTAARELDLWVRAGVHTGEIELRGDDVAGLAIAIGRRVCDEGDGGEVLVSETVRGLLVGSGIAFTDRGEHELRGVPDRWRLYAVDASAS